MNAIYRTLSAAAMLSVLLFSPVATAQADEYWDQRTLLFEILPVSKSDIVFLGNSITDGGEFAELFGMDNIKNRGIRSDVITGVEKRLTQVTMGHPAKLFLLIGINDVSHGLTVAELGRRYERLVRKIREQSPETKLYIQSVMPVNNDFRRYRNLRGREQVIVDFNKKIKATAAAQGAEYIDLWPALSVSGGKLNPAYTNDGLHLNGAGYRAWAKAIEKQVKE